MTELSSLTQSRGYSSNVPRFFLFWALVNFYLWLPIWVVFLQTRGMTLTQIGLIDSFGWVAGAAAEVPTGAVADRYGRKISIILGAVLYAIAMFAVTAKVLSPIFLVGWLLWPASWTFFSGADTAFLYDSLRADGREDRFQKVSGTYMAILQGSQGLASLVGAWVATYDMTLCFIMMGLLSLLGAGVALTFREPPQIKSNSSIRPGYWQTIREATRIVTRRAYVRYIVLFGSVTSVFPFVLVFVLLQPYARGFGFPIWALGFLVLSVRGASAVGSVLSHRVTSWAQPTKLLTASVVIIVASQLLVAGLISPAIIIMFAVIALTNALIRPLLSKLLNEAIPSTQRATIISFESLVQTILLAGFQPVLLAVADLTSIAFAIGLSGVTLAIVGLPLLILWHRSSNDYLQARSKPQALLQ